MSVKKYKGMLNKHYSGEKIKRKNMKQNKALPNKIGL